MLDTTFLSGYLDLPCPHDSGLNSFYDPIPGAVINEAPHWGLQKELSVFSHFSGGQKLSKSGGKCFLPRPGEVIPLAAPCFGGWYYFVFLWQSNPDLHLSLVVWPFHPGDNAWQKPLKNEILFRLMVSEGLSVHHDSDSMAGQLGSW